jgi:hypothetical protein
MKYFTDPAGRPHAFAADGSQDHLIKPGMVPMSEAEELNHRAALRDLQEQQKQTEKNDA